jgi:charged multivesicular body protein 3
MKQQETKVKNLILQADKRAARDAQRQAQARQDMRVFARELIRFRRISTRLITSKAQLNSVQMQINEVFAVRKIEGSIRTSIGVMRDVNSLIRLPELAGTMQELSKELIAAGIIEEMVGENLPEDSLDEFEEEAAEGEVDKVLGEILKDPMATTVELSTEPIAMASQQEEEVDNNDQIITKLEALRS